MTDNAYIVAVVVLCFFTMSFVLLISMVRDGDNAALIGFVTTMVGPAVVALLNAAQQRAHNEVLRIAMGGNCRNCSTDTADK